MPQHNRQVLLWIRELIRSQELCRLIHIDPEILFDALTADHAFGDTGFSPGTFLPSRGDIPGGHSLGVIGGDFFGYGSERVSIDTVDLAAYLGNHF